MPPPAALGKLVVAGASAGGVEALQRLVARLDPDLRAPVLVVVHFPPRGRSALAQILERAGPLPARVPSDGEPMEPGTIFVAPPNRHLIVEDGRVRLVSGPRENLHRPAVDPLFRSAARAHGAGVIAVTLSGSLDDGTAGARDVRSAGGRSIVQDPDEATFPQMPESVIAAGQADEVLDLAALAARLNELTNGSTGRAGLAERAEDVQAIRPATRTRSDTMAGSEGTSDVVASGPSSDPDEVPGRMRKMDFELPSDARPSVFVCPECSGTLWETDPEGVLGFRCRVGHAFTLGTFEAAQGSRVEQALWVSMRALDERASLARRLAKRAEAAGHTSSAAKFKQQADDAEQHLRTVRELIEEVAAPDALAG